MHRHFGRLFIPLFLAIFAHSDAVSARDSSTHLQILTIGNSITRHGPSPKVGWKNSWGMAASTQGSDYLAQLSSSLKHTGAQAQFRVISGVAFERGVQSEESLVTSLPDEHFDVLLLQLGDNAPKTTEARERFAARYADLAIRLRQRFGGSRLLCVGLWRGLESLDRQLEQGCQAAGGRFVRIRDLSADSANDGARSYPGLPEAVRRHPGDIGMKTIAERIFSSLW